MNFINSPIPKLRSNWGRFYSSFGLKDPKQEIKRQNVLKITHVKAEKNDSKKDQKTVEAPTMRIMDLNFPPEKRAAYHQSQSERRASLAACLVTPEQSPLMLKRCDLNSSTP
jgi:hypothetical protein